MNKNFIYTNAYIDTLRRTNHHLINERTLGYDPIDREDDDDENKNLEREKITSSHNSETILSDFSIDLNKFVPIQINSFNTLKNIFNISDDIKDLNDGQQLKFGEENIIGKKDGKYYLSKNCVGEIQNYNGQESQKVKWIKDHKIISFSILNHNQDLKDIKEGLLKYDYEIDQDSTFRKQGCTSEQIVFLKDQLRLNPDMVYGKFVKIQNLAEAGKQIKAQIAFFRGDSTHRKFAMINVFDKQQNFIERMIGEAINANGDLQKIKGQLLQIAEEVNITANEAYRVIEQNEYLRKLARSLKIKDQKQYKGLFGFFQKLFDMITGNAQEYQQHDQQKLMAAMPKLKTAIQSGQIKPGEYAFTYGQTVEDNTSDL